jgi:hypothetical protein
MGLSGTARVVPLLFLGEEISPQRTRTAQRKTRIHHRVSRGAAEATEKLGLELRLRMTWRRRGEVDGGGV